MSRRVAVLVTQAPLPPLPRKIINTIDLPQRGLLLHIQCIPLLPVDDSRIFIENMCFVG